MSIATYAELQTAIINFMDDASITSYVPDFITLAATDIKNDPDISFTSMEVRTQATTSTTDQYLALPTGFLNIKRMHLVTSPQHNINIVPMSVLNEYYTSSTGKPDYAAIVDGQFEFNRICDSAYTVEIICDVITDLSDAQTTNEIFPEYPNLYLYASLIHAAIFVKEDPSIYGKIYEGAVSKYSLKDERKRYAAPLRQRPHPRVVV